MPGFDSLLNALADPEFDTVVGIGPLEKSDVEMLAEAIASKGLTFIWLDESIKIKDKATLLSACAKAANFPDYFGHNWDALLDCLRDLPKQKMGYVLLISDPVTLAKSAPDVLLELGDICESVNTTWISGETGMHLKLLVPEPGTQCFHERQNKE